MNKLLPYIQPHIQAMGNYHPPDDNRLEYAGTLLDFNEKTIPPSPAVKAALQEVIDKNIIQIYPEDCVQLREKIANYVQVRPEQILLTNGSDQAIDLVFRSFTCAQGEVIIPQPSYSMFSLFAEMMNNTLLQPEVNPDLSFPMEGVQAAVTKNTQLIVICNPNNPTGSILSNDDLAQLAEANPQAMIFVDEAYAEFSQQTAVPLLLRYPNIVISRTFSKAFGLAGLRLGYIIARPDFIKEMEKVRDPININIFAYYGARAVLDNINELNSYVDEVMNKAKPLVEKFFIDNAIEYYPSAANFILFKPQQPANDVFEKLRAAGLLTRVRSGAHIDNTIRVTIGTVAQMQKFIEEYTKIL